MLRVLSKQVVGWLVTIGFLLILPGLGQSQTSNPSKRKASDTLIQQAATSFAAGDFRKNTTLLKQAADTDPENPKVWWKLCEAYQLTDQLSLAVKACEEQLNRYPSGSSHNGLGLVYLARKEYRQAADEFEKAAVGSNISQIHSNYVWALLESKQYDRAIPAAKRLVEVSRTDPPELKTTQVAYQYLAIAYMKTGQADKAQEAVSDGYGAGCSMEVGDKPEDSVVRCKDRSTVR